MKPEKLSTNKSLIKKVAFALGELNEHVVFVGGSVASLYADDPAAEDVRPTKDVDIFLEIASYGKLIKLQEKLATKGFYPAIEEGVMCRFRYEDILIDVMSTEEVGWAPADKWFEPGLNYLEQYYIEEIVIKILHVSYYLATKLSAFRDRKEDARTSRHFEDIVYVLDNRKDIVNEIINSPVDVKNYLQNEFQIISGPKYKEAFLSHLYYQTQIERYDIIRGKLIQIIQAT
ncbi:MAG: nucleotidyl transferase AbiEii/AbiGii toxin family protein [Melioribacteraceae bacterium]|nr:nucleotidyl transferase AbiEii/AbiGii toxin family protein [Melioribacteraceae bacterium]